jgi:hypothetical protein
MLIIQPFPVILRTLVQRISFFNVFLKGEKKRKFFAGCRMTVWIFVSGLIYIEIKKNF